MDRIVVKAINAARVSVLRHLPRDVCYDVAGFTFDSDSEYMNEIPSPLTIDGCAATESVQYEDPETYFDEARFMPTYQWKCSACGISVEAVVLMARRDDPIMCVCGALMDRSMVYPFMTSVNEASNWPYDSDALLPSGKRYDELKAKGCIVPDGQGGERIRVEDAKMYKTLCKEQGVKPLDENEKITRSQHRPYKKARKERMEKRTARAVEGARKALDKKGIKV